MHVHEKQHESVVSIKSYRPILICDKRFKYIKDGSQDKKSPSKFLQNIPSQDIDSDVNTSFTSCSDQDLSFDESKINPDQKEEINKFCLIITKIDSENNIITLLYNLSNEWIQWKIDVENILILNGGVKVAKASQLKVGMIGNVIRNRESEFEEFELTYETVMCLWFGDSSQGPSGEDGVLHRRQNILVVQLSTPPAARHSRLVLIHDPRILRMANGLKNGDRVFVWFYSRILQQEKAVTKILEGVAVTNSFDSCMLN